MDRGLGCNQDISITSFRVCCRAYLAFLATGLDKSVKDEVKRRNEKIRDDDTRDANDREIYDMKSEEARKILERQRIQAYVGNIGYIESSKNFEVYIPVPSVSTHAKEEEEEEGQIRALPPSLRPSLVFHSTITLTSARICIFRILVLCCGETFGIDRVSKR